MTEKTGVVGVHDLELREAYINLRKFADTPEGDVAIMIYAKACTNAGARLGVVGVPAEPTEAQLFEREMMERALRIVQEYARQNPCWTNGIGPTQDPWGAHALAGSMEAALAAPPSPLPAPVEPTADALHESDFVPVYCVPEDDGNWSHHDKRVPLADQEVLYRSLRYMPSELKAAEDRGREIDAALNTKRPAP